MHSQKTRGEAEEVGWSQSRQRGGSGCVSRWKQSSVPGAKAASSATQVLWQSPSRVTLTVPGEGDAACAKDLPEEAPACRTCGEEACTWSGMALSSPANPTQPTGFTPCWGVPIAAQLGRDAQQGQASLGPEAQSPAHLALQQHAQTHCGPPCSPPGTGAAVPSYPRAGSSGTAWPGTSST